MVMQTCRCVRTIVKMEVILPTQHEVEHSPNAVHLCLMGVPLMLLNFRRHVSLASIPANDFA